MIVVAAGIEGTGSVQHHYSSSSSAYILQLLCLDMLTTLFPFIHLLDISLLDIMIISKDITNLFYSYTKYLHLIFVKVRFLKVTLALVHNPS